MAAVFVDFPENKCNFLHRNKLDVRRVQFLTVRRPVRSFSPAWGSRHHCPMEVSACPCRNWVTGWCNVNFLRSSKVLGQQCRLCGLKACCCVVVSGRLRRSAKRILRLTHAPVTILINQSIFICSKCPEIHIKGFSIASRTTRLRPALTAAQLINCTMKEKEKTQRVQNSVRWRAHTYTVPGFIGS